MNLFDNPCCHAERSEASPAGTEEILQRFALQNDSQRPGMCRLSNRSNDTFVPSIQGMTTDSILQHQNNTGELS